MDARLRFPNGMVARGVETLTRHRARLRSFLAEECDADGDYLFVSHSEAAQALLLELLGLDSSAYSSFRFKVSRTGIFVVEHETGELPSLVTANARPHLGRLM
jgi:broad specificity phosphatase PhoE